MTIFFALLGLSLGLLGFIVWMMTGVGSDPHAIKRTKRLALGLLLLASASFAAILFTPV